MDWLEALVLGAVQGLTEFLPVSSKGHLALTQQVFDASHGRTGSGAENLFFIVMLHMGTLAAILYHWRQAVSGGIRGALGSDAVATEFQRPQLVRMCLLVVLASLPVVLLGVSMKSMIEATFVDPLWTAFGFLWTASVLSWTAWRIRRRDESRAVGPGQMTWEKALGVGLAQAVALLPGVSRSGMTVAAGLALGLSRTWSVAFSLMISVPAVAGATVLELRDVAPNVLDPLTILVTVEGVVVAGVVGYLAILWLVRLVQGGKLWYCSVYLVVLAVVVFGLVGRGVMGRGPVDGGGTPAPAAIVDRPAGSGV